MKNNYKLYNGFTLAEVLITLGIIGVVAALTIPILVRAYQEHEAVAKVKETYSMVSQAVAQWENEIGCVGKISKCMGEMPWNWGESPATYEGDMEKRLAWTKYLKVSDKRKRYDWYPNWLDYENYGIDGVKLSECTYLGICNHNQAHRTFEYLLANGVILGISSEVGDFMWMDINGKKPPNRIGKDQFPIGFARGWNGNYGVIPYYTECTHFGSSKGVCSQNCPNPCDADNENSLTAYVLKHSKLPDLTKLGYPANP